MDVTMQMRALEAFIKMARRENEGLYHYEYSLQKPPLAIAAPGPRPLPRCTPEEAGVSSVAVRRLICELDRSVETLGVHSMLLMRHGHVIAEACWEPYRKSVPHMLFSASKSIVATAIGMAVDEGLMDIDERLDAIFTGVPKPSGHKWSKLLTLRHLLTMSSGIRFNEMGSILDSDWVRMFMESQPKFEPGTQFEYNSMNSYMLAAALLQKTGLSVTDFLRPRLFEPLGIHSHHWERCPKGIEKGGWGLYLCIEDLARIAQLYLQNGEWEGRQLISREWIAEATTPRIPTPNGEMQNGYGYQIWMGQDGAYQFNGAFGQYAIIMPQQDAVAVVFSGSGRLFAETSLMTLISSCLFASGEEALPPYPAAQDKLALTETCLRFSPPLPHPEYSADAAEFDRICAALSGREYRLSPNHGSLFPQPLQHVHGCYSGHADMLRFSASPGGLAVTLYERYERNTVYISRDGGCTDSLFRIRDEAHLVSTRGVWREQDGSIGITLIICYLEAPNSMVVDIAVSGDQISIVFDERPTADRATFMFMELLGMTDTATLRRLAPAMKHVPGLNENTINDFIKKYAAPLATGRLIRFHDA